MSAWQNWRCEIDSENIAWVTIDRQGEKTNTLSCALVAEFESVIDCIDSKQPKGVVLQSGKASGFIYGADINEFLDLKDEAAAFELIYTTQRLLDRWEALPMPTVAIISGMCLGGGLEVALATRYRVADTEGGTLLGLPEVRLGIQPGWGGTVRLPRLTGIIAAMPLMLTGKMLDPRRAKRLGLVDAAQPMRHCRAAALALLAKKPRVRRLGVIGRFCNAWPIRQLLAKKMRQQVRAQGIRKEHYPAPYAMIDNWRRVGLGKRAFKQEALSIGRLMMTPTARQLIRVFFMQSQLKATAAGADFAGKHIHVVGAGTMGGDIAAWCALQGFQVTLQDQTAEGIAPAMGRAEKLYAKKLRSPRKVRLAMDRLQPDVAGHGIGKADLIIEAIFENLQVKQDLFRDIEQRAKPSAILASNTSSIPLANIATALKNPSRLVGIHFFNPVSQMQLVEVVHDAATSPEVVQQAARFVKDLKRFPLPVKSHPGFLVNRVLMPYLLEAITLFDEGVGIDEIDKAVLSYGMPMGPIRLADTVGLDVCLSVAKNLLPLYGGEMPAVLPKLVEQGYLGVKSKQGFYKYRGKSADVVVKPEKSVRLSQEDITDRLIYRQLNEAVACLREGIVSHADLLDAGMVYGTGFAPFRGGPLQAARDIGLPTVLARFKELEQRYGAGFVADPGWQELDMIVPQNTN
jgi:3-hydroxyacyl-CoA dehydrogenase / enoyl-CoA hydratase / 3-hydroxybutyryl-CoA epimerase